MALLAQSALARTKADTTVPPPLPAESVDTTVLRPTRHPLLIAGGDNTGYGALLLDGDSGRHLATVPGPIYSNFRFDPQERWFLVAESYWTHNTRGPRTDFITLYDARTLEPSAEIPIEGRLISNPNTANFGLSKDGNEAYITDLLPSASVSIVDLEKKVPLTRVETPGCGGVYPWGTSEFAMLCANGSLAKVSRDASGKYHFEIGRPFFDAEKDPLFMEGAVDHESGNGVFISYSGLVYQLDLKRGAPLVGPWSLQVAAKLTAASTEPGDVTWRPGGEKLAAYHRASNRLFVLMHVGEHWSQKVPGTEIWVVDLATKKVILRIPVPSPVGVEGLAVEQDDSAQLYALSAEGTIWTFNSKNGELLRTMDHLGDLQAIPMAAGE